MMITIWLWLTLEITDFQHNKLTVFFTVRTMTTIQRVIVQQNSCFSLIFFRWQSQCDSLLFNKLQGFCWILWYCPASSLLTPMGLLSFLTSDKKRSSKRLPSSLFSLCWILISHKKRLVTPSVTVFNIFQLHVTLLPLKISPQKTPFWLQGNVAEFFLLMTSKLFYIILIVS